MGTNRLNADGLLEQYGTRPVSSESLIINHGQLENNRAWVEYFEDFTTLNADTLAGIKTVAGSVHSTTSAYIAVAGTSLAATTLAAGVNGAIRLLASSSSGTAASGAMLFWANQPIVPANGGGVVECRLRIANTNAGGIDTCLVGFGLAGTTAAIGPTIAATAAADVVSIAGTVLTVNMTDCAAFFYSDGATYKTWHVTSAKAATVNTAVDTGAEATTGVAPVNNTYQTLRIEVDKQGDLVKYFINGSVVKTTLLSITPSVPYIPFVSITPTNSATTPRYLEVDYMYIAYPRT